MESPDLSDLRHADIVVAVLPDGDEVLVKGEVRLRAIVASGIPRRCLIAHAPVPSRRAAEALRRILAAQIDLSDRERDGEGGR